MAFYNTRAFVLHSASKPQRPSPPGGSLGQRLMAMLRGFEGPGRAGQRPVSESLTAEFDALDQGAPRFALVRHGYDRVAVDQYVADLERELAALDHELAELRGGAIAADEVTNQLKRIGEQTSAVLMAAHEQREEMLRRAKAEADHSVSEATATASALAAQSEMRLRELKAETDAAHGERARLLDDLRTVSSALAAVADAAEARLPPAQDR